jgi:hypothetical protein
LPRPTFMEVPAIGAELSRWDMVRA